MTAWYAGIDGGQSGTRAVIGDARGRILGRGESGPADEVGEGPDSSRLASALEGAMASAMRDAGLPDGARAEVVVAGISGYAGSVRGRAPSLPARRTVLVHDLPIAHAAAFGAGPGIAVIAGTGSAALARDLDGRERTCGGWGYLFGDEGGAFALARDALATLMRDLDEHGIAGDDHGRAARFFGARDLRDVAARVAAGAITRAQLAAFAREVLAMPRFAPLVERAAGEAVRLAVVAARGLRWNGPPPVAFSGGLARDARYRALLSEQASSAGLRCVTPVRSACDGALLLAYREASVGVAELLG